MSYKIVTGHSPQIKTINTNTIYNAHQEIKRIVDEYIDLQAEVHETTLNLTNQWAGIGCEEFKRQYKELISKIDDFGVVMAEIYENLVNSEAEYEGADLALKNDINMAMKEVKNGEQ